MIKLDATVSFGEWIRQRRRALDLTQDELARRVGCAAVTVKKIELDERRPSRQMAELLATCLAVPATERHRFVERARGERQPEHLSPLTTVPFEITPPAVAPVATHPQPLLTPLPARSNLPAPPTDLVGRDELVTQLSQRLLSVNGRLLTLIGPPGIGKTRLALAIATRLVTTFADGVYFVPLASITDTDYVAPAIATELGLSEAGQSSLPIVSRLIENLQHKTLLLLLDNFEQVISAASVVAELLVGCPRLRILVTSQETLRLRAEQRFVVPPLDPQSAAALFHQCALSIDPDFVENPTNRAPIDAICQQLDGMPLAIELIAARIDLLTPQAMLSRLQERPLHLLNTGPRDLPVRHRTLRDALQRSYELLSDDEQRLLCRLSVFAGGCELASVEAVCGEGFTGEVIDLLGSLVNRSLVRIDTPTTHEGGEPRFSLLETIRLYAADQLEAATEGRLMRTRHVAHFLTLAEESFAIMEGDTRHRWFARVDREQDNLRAALRYSMEVHDTQTALQLAAGLMGFWSVRSHYEEGRRWLAQTLAAAPQPTLARARALFAAGALAQEQNDWINAQHYLEESLVIFRTSSDRLGTAEAIQALAWVEYDLRATDSAQSLFRECLELYRKQGDGEHVAIVLTSLVLLEVEQAQSVDYESSVAALTEALNHFHTQQQMDGVAYATYARGMLELRVGHAEEAVSALSESRRSFEALNARRSIAQSSLALGEATRQLNDWDAARHAYEQAQTLFHSLGIKQAQCESLLGLGHVERGMGNLDTAIKLYTRSLGLSREVNDTLLAARSLAGMALVMVAQAKSEASQTHITQAVQLAGTWPIFVPHGDRNEWQRMINKNAESDRQTEDTAEL